MFHTMLFFLSLVMILVGAGWLIGGIWGGLIGLVLAAAINLWAYWYSDRVVLRIYNAQPTKDYKLTRMAERLAKEAKIPAPKIYMVKTSNMVPNAFATGRNPKNAAICLTGGLLSLKDDEIEAVMAHEMAHIKNHDTLVQMMAATIAGAVSYLAQIGYWSLFFYDDSGGRGNVLSVILVVIFAPLAALLLKLAISRNREFGADYVGAHISKKPRALASALKKIDQMSRERPMTIKGGSATSHLWIVNPLKPDWFNRLFSTHPDTEERIKRLVDLDIGESI